MSKPAGFKWYDDGGAMLDQIICDCGWESATFFDGREYAYSQWKRHVKEKHDVVVGRTPSQKSRIAT
jgi:hypothetical protein